MLSKSYPTGLMQCKQFWTFWLSDYPNQDFVRTIERYLTEGIDIGFKGPRENIVSPNWPSSQRYHSQVTTFIQDNIGLGAVAGPLSDVPGGYRASPLGAFERKTSAKVRVIHDLSWPPGKSVNDYISSTECTLSYVTVEQAAICACYIPNRG